MFEVPIKAALADRKKVVKTGSIFMGRGRGHGQGQCWGKIEGHRQGNHAIIPLKLIKRNQIKMIKKL